MRDYQREAQQSMDKQVAALSDIVDVLVELPNQLVEVINAIDRQTEVLERIEHELKDSRLPQPDPFLNPIGITRTSPATNDASRG